MNEFQVGDLVKCVDNDIYEQVLTEGLLYEVIGVDDNTITIFSDQNSIRQFHYTRFVLHKAGKNNYKAKYEQLESVVDEFVELMECSKGVTGLNLLDGSVAEWDWLRHTGWLDNLNKYLGE